ncbi:MAG: hypothetical protein HY006_01625 [Candidatus Sungbacteria bacterium]|nr:hypothetical protein [Candidatus Sungbacteria bacterium]
MATCCHCGEEVAPVDVLVVDEEVWRFACYIACLKQFERDYEKMLRDRRECARQEAARQYGRAVRAA